MEAVIFYIIIRIAVGYWCSTIAKKNKRSEGLAWIMGLIFGLFAVVTYYLIGKTQATRDAEILEKLRDVK